MHLYLKEKSIIKVPKNIDILFCSSTNVLTLIGVLQKKAIKIDTQIFFLKNKKFIIVTDLTNSKISNKKMKNLKSIKGTLVAKIKQAMTEITYTLYLKLNFVGVGYRAFNLDPATTQLYFKLGYSHLIYFKIPKPLKIKCLKFTKLFIYGNSLYDQLTETAALIRKCRSPEPYKGKGILYHNEKIKLKRGKKI